MWYRSRDFTFVLLWMGLRNVFEWCLLECIVGLDEGIFSGGSLFGGIIIGSGSSLSVGIIFLGFIGWNYL